MKKMFGMKAALVLALVGGGIITSCSNGSDGGENPVVGGEIVARMTTVNSELTFYENGTVKFKEDAATKSVLARAVTSSAASSLGTYSGNVTQDKAEISLSFTEGKRTGSGTATIAERDDASNISMDIGGENLKLERIQTLVTAWRATTKSETGKDFIETMYFYSDGTFMIVMNKKVSDQITNGFAGTYTGDTTKNGETVYATIAEFAALGALPGTITGNKLKIDAPMNITYDRID